MGVERVTRGGGAQAGRVRRRDEGKVRERKKERKKGELRDAKHGEDESKQEAPLNSQFPIPASRLIRSFPTGPAQSLGIKVPTTLVASESAEEPRLVVEIPPVPTALSPTFCSSSALRMLNARML